MFVKATICNGMVIFREIIGICFPASEICMTIFTKYDLICRFSDKGFTSKEALCNEISQLSRYDKRIFSLFLTKYQNMISRGNV